MKRIMQLLLPCLALAIFMIAPAFADTGPQTSDDVTLTVENGQLDIDATTTAVALNDATIDAGGHSATMAHIKDGASFSDTDGATFNDEDVGTTNLLIGTVDYDVISGAATTWGHKTALKRSSEDGSTVNGTLGQHAVNEDDNGTRGYSTGAGIDATNDDNQATNPGDDAADSRGESTVEIVATNDDSGTTTSPGTTDIDDKELYDDGGGDTLSTPTTNDAAQPAKTIATPQVVPRL